MDRKDYWNQTYVDYFKARVTESNIGKQEESKLIEGDVKVADDHVAEAFFDQVTYVPGMKLLDFGCGWARFFHFFREKGVDYYGIDISEQMISSALEDYPNLETRLFVAEGEELPFSNDFFDRIVCYGTFDACYQESALAEMLRVLKKGGRILISGKTADYFDDDGKALLAERNARKKGHPNYFTNTPMMQEELARSHVSIPYAEYFLRRGDMGRLAFSHTIPERFYEYRLVLEKEGDGETGAFPPFSDAYSSTYRRIVRGGDKALVRKEYIEIPADGMVCCIVDGITVSMLLSILFQGRRIDCCILEERSRPFFSTASVGERLVIALILSELSIATVYVEKFDDVSLLDTGTPEGMTLLMKNAERAGELWAKFPKEQLEHTYFYGAPTSTLMQFLPAREDHIYHLDSGTEGLFRLHSAQGKALPFPSEETAATVLQKILPIHNYPNRNLIGKGYTLASLTGDFYVHVDYRAFQNRKLAVLFREGREKARRIGKRLVLMLPASQLEYDILQATYQGTRTVIDFSTVYESMLSTVNPSEEAVLIKLHPISYLRGGGQVQEVLETVGAVCRKLSIASYSVEDFLGDSIANALPVEIFCRYLSVSALLMMGSTSGLNIAVPEGDVRCYSYTELPGYEEEYMGIYKEVNPYIIHIK